jgi:autotransporter strand-loop-strand O-heptosyltransferase
MEIFEKKPSDNQDWLSYLSETFSKHHLPFAPSITDERSGIRLDFCWGLRILFPDWTYGEKYRLQVFDFKSKLQILDEIIPAEEYYVSEKKYLVDYGIIISNADTGEEILRHRFDCAGKDVVINMPVPTMGDSIAWFQAAVNFEMRSGCRLFVAMPEHTRKLFEPDHPDVKFITQEQIECVKPYACYQMGVDMDGGDTISPVDYRQVSLAEYGGYILGLEPHQIFKPALFSVNKKQFDKPHVCISTQASGLCKMWLHPEGWEKVVDFLKESGYRVLDIDLNAKQVNGIFHNAIPRNAEDFTGNISLRERAELISGADFFIGLGSGLSWLASCCQVPVVLISGFSMPFSEFFTPYRVINYNVCHGCYSDTRYKLNPQEYDWCPKHKGTSRHFECTRGITPEMVIEKIKQIPEFYNRTKGEKQK